MDWLIQTNRYQAAGPGLGRARAGPIFAFLRRCLLVFLFVIVLHVWAILCFFLGVGEFVFICLLAFLCVFCAF